MCIRGTAMYSTSCLNCITRAIQRRMDTVLEPVRNVSSDVVTVLQPVRAGSDAADAARADENGSV